MNTSVTALAVVYPDTAALARSFLSWPIRRGVFVPTTKALPFGESVFLSVRLPFKALPTFASGRVVWRSEQGVGIGFDEGFDDLADLLEDVAKGHRDQSSFAFFRPQS